MATSLVTYAVVIMKVHYIYLRYDHLKRLSSKYIELRSKSVAQSDARPTGDQEVAGSIPPGPATFFPGDWS